MVGGKSLKILGVFFRLQKAELTLPPNLGRLTIQKPDVGTDSGFPSQFQNTAKTIEKLHEHIPKCF